MSSPSYKLDVNGDTNIAQGSVLRFAGTQVCSAGGCTSSSDRRLKENIRPLENSLEKVLRLEGVEYDYVNKKRFSDRHQIGVIAQQVEAIYPEVVVTDEKTGLKSVAYDHLIAPIIESIKTIYNSIKNLEAEKNQIRRDVAAKADQAEVNERFKKLEEENSKLKDYIC